MLKQINSVFLADDDDDDCFLFNEAFHEVAKSTKLTIFHNGEELMKWLTKVSNQPPDILFLDLNMPRKNGFECLAEIKQNNALQNLIVIIFSTSFQSDVADKLYVNGAHYYMRKPSRFEDLKRLIQHAMLTIQQRWATGMFNQPLKENFVLSQ